MHTLIGEVENGTKCEFSVAITVVFVTLIFVSGHRLYIKLSLSPIWFVDSTF